MKRPSDTVRERMSCQLSVVPISDVVQFSSPAISDAGRGRDRGDGLDVGRDDGIGERLGVARR